jgi:site-specific DNA-methyltransferase (adenine-specific)
VRELRKRAVDPVCQTNEKWEKILADLARFQTQSGRHDRAANDDVPAQSDQPQTRSTVSEVNFFSVLNVEWAGVWTLRKRLACAGIEVSLATVRASMRSLAAADFKRVESATSPDRWRRKPDTNPTSIPPHPGPMHFGGACNFSAGLTVANDNSSNADEAEASLKAFAIVKSGDLSNKIGDSAIVHQGDCLEIMRSMPSGCVDLIFTSPPYNLGVSRGRKRANKTNTNWKSPLLDHGYASYNDARDPADYDNWQKECLTEMWRLLSSTGAIFYVHKARVQGKILQTPLRLNPGLPLRQIVTWDRGSGNNFNSYFFTPSAEWVLIFAKPDFKLSGLTPRERDVWRILPERGSSHPAPFPVALPLTAIRNTSAGVVLDPFMGSGSTGVAALRLGRKFVGLELDAGYVEMAKSRLAAELQARGKTCC